MEDRIVITGMSVLTPVGDNLNDFYNNLIEGKSAITKIRTINTDMIKAKIGGDLGDYDFNGKIGKLSAGLPAEISQKIKNSIPKYTLSNKLTVLSCMEALIDAGYFESGIKDDALSCVLAGHNLHSNYFEENIINFIKDRPIDDDFLFKSHDTNVVCEISSLLKITGDSYLIGGTCASSGIALKNGIYELLYNDHKMAVVGGAVLDYSALGLQALILADAISYKKYNDVPHLASRPFDRSREGFVAAHGTGFVVIERLKDALKRKAHIYAEILGIEYNNDANHLPNPSSTGQVYIIKKLLNKAGIKESQIDYVNAHATSTELGDKTEAKTIQEVFRGNLDKIKVNAPKSMLGHTCWAAHIVELIAGIMQMNNSMLHPSINIDSLDETVNFDVCPNIKQKHNIDFFINNSFGFGGINCSSLIRKFD